MGPPPGPHRGFMYKKQQRVYCDFAQFNSALLEARSYYNIRQGPWKPGNMFDAYLQIEKTKVFLTYKKGKTTTTYIFRLDCEDPTQYVDGSEAYRIMKTYAKDLPDLRGDTFYNPYLDKDENGNFCLSTIGTCSADASFNKSKSGHRYNDCYGYDLNSAWPYFLTKPIPDTSQHPRMWDYVQDNEIGFDTTNDGNWKLRRKGQYAQFIFGLIESPFKRFVNIYYTRKRDAISRADKMYYKGVLNYSIGYLQRTNPFIRAMVICQANEYIESLIMDGKNVKDNVLLWNTDSIVSTIELPELKLGRELGEWKLEHRGSFAFIGNTYQWNYDVPTHKGVAKGWYKKKYPNGFDLLKDPIPTVDDNFYYITDKFELKMRGSDEDS